MSGCLERRHCIGNESVRDLRALVPQTMEKTSQRGGSCVILHSPANAVLRFRRSTPGTVAAAVVGAVDVRG